MKKEEEEFFDIGKISRETARKIVVNLAADLGVDLNKCPKCGANFTEEIVKLLIDKILMDKIKEKKEEEERR